MDLIRNSILAFFSTVGFSVLFNIPRKMMVKAGICGMLGWSAYILASHYIDNIVGLSFVGAAVIGLLGEMYATKERHPATIFIIPGIITLVPGYGLYYTMLYIVESNFDMAIIKGSETVFVAIAIACGVILATTIMRLFKK